MVKKDRYAGTNSVAFLLAAAMPGAGVSAHAQECADETRNVHGELYLDPELVQEMPLSHLAGLGGMSNGEQQKTGGPDPTLYRARLFLRHSWPPGGERIANPADNRARGPVSIGAIRLHAQL